MIEERSTILQELYACTHLGGLAQAHHIDPSLHKTIHNVVHSCIGVSARQDGGEGVQHGGSPDHDFHECQKRSGLASARRALHVRTHNQQCQPVAA